MLVLNRKVEEKIDIYFRGKVITVVLCSVGSARARIGIEAPEEARIVRRELGPLMTYPIDAARR